MFKYIAASVAQLPWGDFVLHFRLQHRESVRLLLENSRGQGRKPRVVSFRS